MRERQNVQQGKGGVECCVWGGMRGVGDRQDGQQGRSGGGGGGRGETKRAIRVEWKGRVGGPWGVGGSWTDSREGVEWGGGGGGGEKERRETKTNILRCPLILASPQPAALS